MGRIVRDSHTGGNLSGGQPTALLRQSGNLVHLSRSCCQHGPSTAFLVFHASEKLEPTGEQCHVTDTRYQELGPSNREFVKQGEELDDSSFVLLIKRRVHYESIDD